MTVQVPPPATSLGHATYPHRRYHGALTEVRYAHSDGDDTRDGLTWGTAKQTIMAAYDALPAAGGDVLIGGDAVDIGTTGIWLLGANDSGWNGGNLTAPLLAAGWRAQKRCRFIGTGPQNHAANSEATQTYITHDGTGPTIWVSGTNVPITFKNLYNQYPYTFARIGVDSNGTTRHTNTSNITFEKVAFQVDNVNGSGPGVDQGGDTFWIRWRGCTFAGPYVEDITPSTVTAAGTTCTVTWSANHNLQIGDWVRMFGFTPSGYNGDWQVKTTPSATQFTVTLTSSPAAVSVMGQCDVITSDKRCAYLIRDLGTGTGFTGETFIDSGVFNGGGLRYYGNNGTWNFYLRYVVQEGTFGDSHVPPIVEAVHTGGGGFGIVEYCGTADASSPLGGVHVVTAGELDGGALGSQANGQIMVRGLLGSVKGPASVENATSIVEHPALRGQSLSYAGLSNIETMGQRRAAGLVPVRFTNLVSHDSSTWASWSGGGSATVTTGKDDPFGGTQAARFSSGGGQQEKLFLSSRTLALGDAVLAGVWSRPVATTAASSGLSMQVFGGSVYNYVSGNITDTNVLLGNAWEWLWILGIITTLGTTPENIGLALRCDTGLDMDYYGPILVHIPASAGHSESELREFGRHAATWPSTAPAGSISTLREERLYALGGVGLQEHADFSAPSVNEAVLYAKDNGSGKTQLVVRFPTGAVQVLATEP